MASLLSFTISLFKKYRSEVHAKRHGWLICFQKQYIGQVALPHSLLLSDEKSIIYSIGVQIVNLQLKLKLNQIVVKSLTESKGV